MQLEEIGVTARTFQAQLRRRRLLEYAAAMVVIAVFAAYAYVLPSWMIKTGLVLSILAMANIIWQRRARTAARPVPEAPAAALVEFHRAELIRHRDAAGRSWLTEILPVIPGFVLILAGRLLQFHPPRTPVAFDTMIVVLASIIAVLALVIAALGRRIVIYKIEKQIDALDRLRGAAAS
jgi:hypothetical protein